jgi:peroxiredoxin
MKTLAPLFALLLLGLAACAGLRPGGEPNGFSRMYDVDLPDTRGGRVSFGQFRGQVLLVDFFTTWLNPSLINAGLYADLYRRHRARGLRVVGVSLDDQGAALVEAFERALDLPYPVALADGSMRAGASVFGDLEALPRLMVFDRQGRLAGVWLGLAPAGELERLIEKLL